MILGTSGKAKIIYDKGGNKERVYTFDYQAYRSLKVMSDEIVHKSALSSERTFIDIGDSLDAEFHINIFKAPSRIDEVNKIKFFNKKEVVFYPHCEGINIKQPNGEDAKFKCNVTLSYLNTRDFKDLLIVRIRSTTDIDIWQSVLPPDVLIDSDGMVITDSDGKYLIGE